MKEVTILILILMISLQTGCISENKTQEVEYAETNDLELTLSEADQELVFQLKLININSTAKKAFLRNARA